MLKIKYIVFSQFRPTIFRQQECQLYKWTFWQGIDGYHVLEYICIHMLFFLPTMPFCPK